MLTFEQTKQLVDFAKNQSSWESVESFINKEFKIKEGVNGIYAASLEKFPKLLETLTPTEIENVLGFISKRFLLNSPLKNKLTIDQKQKMQIASIKPIGKLYPTLSKILKKFKK